MLRNLDLLGYMPNNERDWNILIKLGFRSNSDVFQPGATHLIIEKENIWFSDITYSGGRLAGKEINLVDVIRLVNEFSDMKNVYCKANIGTFASFIKLGYNIGDGFSDNTKYLYTDDTMFVNGAEACSEKLKDKTRVKLIDGKFINCGKPKISIEEAIALFGGFNDFSKKDIGDNSES